MNKNKIDLNSYLTRYGQQTSGDLNFGTSRSKSKRESAFEQLDYTPTHVIEQHAFQTTQTHYTGFSKSQNQCIQQLQQIKRSLVNEQRQLSYFLENYSKKLYDNLLIEHNRIREQLLDMFDRVFSQSERRISDIVARENGTEPLEFISIRKRITQINQRIDELDGMLRSDNYRKAIAEVVTSDFENQMRNKNVLDNAVKLVLDQNAFSRLKDDIHNLVITDGSKKNMHAQQFPPMNSALGTSQRRQSRGRLGLFDTAPQFKDPQNNGGNYFNFGS